MTLRAILLHLRLPFSLFLLPVFWFALSQSVPPDLERSLLIAFILHFLLYPASNAYNSFFDKDEESIGVLENPPPVDQSLHYVAWGLDILALLLGMLVGWPFALYLLIYGLISKAYSHDRIRLKKYPVWSWLIVSSFQGGFTYLMTLQAINNVPLDQLFTNKTLLASSLCTLNVMAMYPVTQIYQHAEDARRGDLTLSRLLGIQGTFLCTFLVFSCSLLGFYIYFEGRSPFYLLLAFVLPAIIFFSLWFLRVRQDSTRADFRSAMRMTILSCIGLNGFFLTLLLMK
ncbi:MAG: UbiA family prenyltransferase [Rudanella sp.]|nr:UbiA family prenyltransferase [Rudanella sp.]